MNTQNASLKTAGYSRRKQGKSFIFLDTSGRKIKSAAVTNRLKRLAVPPAYEDVWYSPDPKAHLQAFGYDARGRKQYRYHADWIAHQDHNKYSRMISFAKKLPLIRKRTSAHLKLHGLPREKVLGTVVKLLEKTLIRVGNEEYAKKNHSYGLTTLKNSHVEIQGAHIKFKFKGKSHVLHDIEIENLELAQVIKKCQDLPEKEIFEYVDEDQNRHDIKSQDINTYIKEISGENFTAKDFRTWAGTLLAAQALSEYKSFTSQNEAKKQIIKAIESVSEKLGNTKAVCRKSYVHPEVINAHMDGTLQKIYKLRVSKILKGDLKKLSKNEALVLMLLEKKFNKGRTNGKTTRS